MVGAERMISGEHRQQTVGRARHVGIVERQERGQERHHHDERDDPETRSRQSVVNEEAPGGRAPDAARGRRSRFQGRGCTQVFSLGTRIAWLASSLRLTTKYAVADDSAPPLTK